MSSRWAATEDDAELEAQRKRDREEKRRLKAELQQQKDLGDHRINQEAGIQKSEPPTKRQKTSQRTDEGEIDDAHLLPFPTSSFGPSSSLSHYDILNRIEEGSYGLVSRAKSKSSGEVVALKRLKVDPKSHEGFSVTGLREIQTLRACSHNHIVRLREVVVGEDPTQE